MIGQWSDTGWAHGTTLDQHEGMNSRPWLVGSEYFLSLFMFFPFLSFFVVGFFLGGGGFVPLSAGRYSRSGNTLRPPHHIS